MSFARIVYECLRPINPSSEVRSWTHPSRGELYAVLWRNDHSESRVGTLYFDAVGRTCELERVIGGFVGMLVFLAVIPKLKRGHPDGLHNILLYVVSVFQSCYFLYNPTQE